MKRFLMVLMCAVLSVGAFAQTAFEIGRFENNEAVLNEDKSVAIIKAFEWSFRDGTKVSELRIEQLGSSYYLVAYAEFQGKKRIAAIDLDISGMKLTVMPDAQMKTCSANACDQCRFFIENNKIIACKCENTGTISNHCHFKQALAPVFYNNLDRAIKLKTE